MGTEIGMLRGYEFQGQVTAGDSPDKKSKMGAGYINLKIKNKKQQCKVGREEGGSSSNQPELVMFLLALRDTPTEEPLLYSCDNQSLLKAVNRWITKGGKATPDAARMIFWQQASRYYQRGLQRGQQPSWSK